MTAPTAARRGEGFRIALGYDAALAPMSGIPRYVRRLASELAQSPEVDKLVLTAGFRTLERAAANALPPTLAQGPGPRLRQAVGRNLVTLPVIRDATLALRRIPLERSLARSGIQLVHEPNYMTRRLRLPTVVTIHDMSIYAAPETHPADRVAWFHREIPRSIAAARRIITLSEFSRRDILARFPTAEGRVDVIPVGLDIAFRPRTEAEAGGTLAAHGLSWRDYLLFVGTLEPRKNLEGVLNSLELIPPEIRRPLVVVGSGGWSNQSLLARLAAAEAQGHLRRIGQVTDVDLINLYAGARGCVFPSFYEGQGLPALEAAACGTPVLTSINSPMAMALGDLALTVDPTSRADMARGLQRLMADDGLLHRALAEAASIGQRNSWSRCVADTLACYRKALAGEKHSLD